MTWSHPVAPSATGTMIILGLETSCDETAAAVVGGGTQVRSNVVWSQHELHEKYRGVVPEIASRAHLERLWPVVQAAIREADVTIEDIDAIAVGHRPGLIGSLIVGVSAAAALAWSTGKPLIGVDHVQAHLWAAYLRQSSPCNEDDLLPETVNATSTSRPTHQPKDPTCDYPALGLVVSGGHSSIYLVHSPQQMQLLGRTIDDAVGEAYDKAAVILGLGYPGGPALDKLAQTGNAFAVDPLPRSMLGPDSLDFSFSGLKTALLYRVRGHPTGRGSAASFARSTSELTDVERRDLAAAFQDAAIDALIQKLQRAAVQLEVHSIVIGGGVSANSLLRQRGTALGDRLGLPVRIPVPQLCLDNAAMIAGLAHAHLNSGHINDLDLPAIATTDS